MSGVEFDQKRAKNDWFRRNTLLKNVKVFCWWGLIGVFLGEDEGNILVWEVILGFKPGKERMIEATQLVGSDDYQVWSALIDEMTEQEPWCDGGMESTGALYYKDIRFLTVVVDKAARIGKWGEWKIIFQTAGIRAEWFLIIVMAQAFKISGAVVVIDWGERFEIVGCTGTEWFDGVGLVSAVTEVKNEELGDDGFTDMGIGSWDENNLLGSIALGKIGHGVGMIAVKTRILDWDSW